MNAFTGTSNVFRHCHGSSLRTSLRDESRVHRVTRPKLKYNISISKYQNGYSHYFMTAEGSPLTMGGTSGCAIIVSYASSQAVSVGFAKFRKWGQNPEILPAELPGYGTLNHRFEVHPAACQGLWKGQPSRLPSFTGT